MNPIRLTLLFGAVTLLAACATTPEQKPHAPKRRNAMSRIFQVNLAAQCDQEIAALIRRKFDEEGKPGVATAEQKSLPPQNISTKFPTRCSKPATKWHGKNYISKSSCAKPATIAITTIGVIRLAVILVVVKH